MLTKQMFLLILSPNDSIMSPAADVEKKNVQKQKFENHETPFYFYY